MFSFLKGLYWPQVIFASIGAFLFSGAILVAFIGTMLTESSVFFADLFGLFGLFTVFVLLYALARFAPLIINEPVNQDLYFRFTSTLSLIWMVLYLFFS